MTAGAAGGAAGGAVGEADLQGHWQRRWLKSPGVHDGTTRVHWLQSGAVYADIRIPADRPDLRGCSGLSDLGDGALSRLLGAEGFAGEIIVQGGVCTWVRDLNWHGAPQGTDAGRLSFDAAGELVEEGVHARYSELWYRMSDAGSFAHRAGGDGFRAILVSVGHRFVFGFGRADLPPAHTARAELAAGRRGEAVARQFGEGFALGHWEAGTGVVDLATNPFWERRSVLTLDDTGVRFVAFDFHGRPAPVRFELEGAALV